MKKTTLLIMAIFSCSILSGQVNRYDSFNYAPVNYPSFEEMYRVAAARQAQYDQVANYLNALVNWVFELQQAQTDQIFQREIDGHYKLLKLYYSTNDLSRAGNNLKQIELKIRESITSYNRRIQQSNTTSGNTQRVPQSTTSTPRQTHQYTRTPVAPTTPQMATPPPNNPTYLNKAHLMKYRVGIYTEPINTAPRIGEIPPNTQITILYDAGSYYYIDYNNQKGYVAKINFD